MTEEQHAKMMTKLKGDVTRAKTAMSKPMSLEHKLAAKSKVRDAEESLCQHKLNFYELTRQS